MLDEILESGSVSVVVATIVLVAPGVVVAEESSTIELVNSVLVVLSARLEVDALLCIVGIDSVEEIDDSVVVVDMLTLAALLYSDSDEIDVDVASGIDIVEDVVGDSVEDVEVMYW